MIGDPAAIEAMLVKLRLASVMRGRVGAQHAVNVSGLGTVVVKKERPSHVVAEINGKRVETIDLVRAADRNTLVKAFGGLAGDKASAASRQSR